MTEESRTRRHDAVLVCLGSSDGPLTTGMIIEAFVKAGSKRRFEEPELEALLKELKNEGLVEEVGEVSWRITGEGRTTLGPLGERSLAEI